MAGNKLVGSIPASLGGLTTLSHLSLAGNELSGTIPDNFGNLTLLQYLRYVLAKRGAHMLYGLVGECFVFRF